MGTAHHWVVWSILLIGAAPAAAATSFFDNFNRPDGALANGWSNVSYPNFGPTIRDGRVFVTEEGRIARAFDAHLPLSINAQLFSNARDYYDIDFRFSDTLAPGGSYVSFSINRVNFTYGGWATSVEAISVTPTGSSYHTRTSPYGFTGQLDVKFDVNSAGTVSAQLSQGTAVFDATFTPNWNFTPTIFSVGGNAVGAGVDNLNVTSGLPPRTFGMCIGQDEGTKVRGGSAAQRVYDKLSKSGNWASESSGNTKFPYTFSTSGDTDAGLAVLGGLARMDVQPGDTVIFYYNGHGGRAIPKESAPANERPDLLGYADDETLANGLSDDELFKEFSRPKWHGVRKIFLIDACHSGGFVGGNDSDGQGDLDRLDNYALFAAATEETSAYAISKQLDSDYGIGQWTRDYLLPALDRHAITAEGFAQFMRDHSHEVSEKYAGQEMTLPISTGRERRLFSARPISSIHIRQILTRLCLLSLSRSRCCFISCWPPFWRSGFPQGGHERLRFDGPCLILRRQLFKRLFRFEISNAA
ncbi:MAG TPA: caspase family protein [Tepidisphaeraceae bacterium]